MREIKFRVCNSSGDILAYEYFIIQFGWHYIIKQAIDQYGGEAHVHSGIYPDGVNTLYRDQYIGLKDKNGEEIFFGDIVRSFEQEDFIHEIIFEHGAFGYISSHDNSFISYHSNKCNLEVNQKRIYQVEIIGNVHANPELL